MSSRLAQVCDQRANEASSCQEGRQQYMQRLRFRRLFRPTHPPHHVNKTARGTGDQQSRRNVRESISRPMFLVSCCPTLQHKMLPSKSDGQGGESSPLRRFLGDADLLSGQVVEAMDKRVGLFLPLSHRLSQNPGMGHRNRLAHLARIMPLQIHWNSPEVCRHRA